MCKFNAWILATRPRTLPAAIAPVVLASAMAYADKNFVWLPAIAAFTVALLLQIGVNLANDYFDYQKGIDTADRLGPLRVTQSGLIPATEVKVGMIMVFILSLIPGFYLLAVGGWPVLIIGLVCISAALVYSGGPFPLASHGLGDLFASRERRTPERPATRPCTKSSPPAVARTRTRQVRTPPAACTPRP